jgi:hypothetical protein
MHNEKGRFFPRDDCEGRLQQGLLILLALLALGKMSLAEIKDLLKRENTGLFDKVNEQDLDGILNVLLTIANLFRAEIITFHMIVGEAAFASFGQLEDPHHPKKVEGHSFGLLVFDPSVPPKIGRLPDYKHMEKWIHVVEATGWMDEYQTTEEQLETKRFSQSVKPSNPHITVRACTTMKQCDMIYCFMYMIDDHMIFSKNQLTGKWGYGATPAQIFNEDVVLLTPTQFVEAMLQPSTRAPDSRNPEIIEIAQQVYKHERSGSQDMRKTPHILKLMNQIDQSMADDVLFIHSPPIPYQTQLQELEKWGKPQTSKHPTLNQNLTCNTQENSRPPTSARRLTRPRLAWHSQSHLDSDHPHAHPTEPWWGIIS